MQALILKYRWGLGVTAWAILTSYAYLHRIRLWRTVNTTVITVIIFFISLKRLYWLYGPSWECRRRRKKPHSYGWLKLWRPRNNKYYCKLHAVRLGLYRTTVILHVYNMFRVPAARKRNIILWLVKTRSAPMTMHCAYRRAEFSRFTSTRGSFDEGSGIDGSIIIVYRKHGHRKYGI